MTTKLEKIKIANSEINRWTAIIRYLTPSINNLEKINHETNTLNNVIDMLRDKQLDLSHYIENTINYELDPLPDTFPEDLDGREPK